MPKLKQITCSIEIGHSRTRLTEYGARYSDGSVESFIAVPETQVPFCIRVQSNGYIAPGLAAFVFMDGQYQCNRNKLKLNIPTDNMPTNQYEVDFCLRQKEEKTASGTFVGRDWSFAQLDTCKIRLFFFVLTAAFTDIDSNRRQCGDTQPELHPERRHD